LRFQLEQSIKNNLPAVKYQLPDTKYSIDNAAMIAAAACFRYSKRVGAGSFSKKWSSLKTEANLKLI
jgi:tRNA A37 threonylcarbamoyltransferase TsaD